MLINLSFSYVAFAVVVFFSLPNYNLWQWVICLCRIAFAGHRPDFILPDRKKYVSMDKQYLKSYMDLVIKVKKQLSLRERKLEKLAPRATHACFYISRLVPACGPVYAD